MTSVIICRTFTQNTAGQRLPLIWTEI